MVKYLLVSDTGFRYIIIINVRKFTPRYKQMCRCEVCIQAKQLQRSLNAWRNKNSIDNLAYRRVVMPNDMTLHPKPRDAIQNMLCPYTSIGKLYYIIFCLIILQILMFTFLYIYLINKQVQMKLNYQTGNLF